MASNKLTLDDLPDVESVLEGRPLVFLLIEDEADHVAAVGAILRGRDSVTAFGEIELVHAATAEAARDLLAARRFDLLIVDWHLGPDSGLSLLEDVRSRGLTTPTVMLTTDSRLALALDTGADCFVSKATMHAELRARVGALLRRARVRTELTYGRLTINYIDNAARFAGRRLKLGQIELTMLGFLALREARATTPGVNATSPVVDVADLLEHVWGYNPRPWKDGVTRVIHPGTNVLDKTASVLRGALNTKGVPPVIEKVPATMTREQAKRLKLSPEEQSLARDLTRGFRFAAEAPLGAVASGSP